MDGSNTYRPSQDQDDRETWESLCEDNLKPAINNLLWMFLPPSTRLIDAENFACNIFETIRDRWESESLREGADDDKSFPPKPKVRFVKELDGG